MREDGEAVGNPNVIDTRRIALRRRLLQNKGREKSGTMGVKSETAVKVGWKSDRRKIRGSLCLASFEFQCYMYLLRCQKKKKKKEKREREREQEETEPSKKKKKGNENIERTRLMEKNDAVYFILFRVTRWFASSIVILSRVNKIAVKRKSRESRENDNVSDFTSLELDNAPDYCRITQLWNYRLVLNGGGG